MSLNQHELYHIQHPDTATAVNTSISLISFFHTPSYRAGSSYPQIMNIPGTGTLLLVVTCQRVTMRHPDHIADNLIAVVPIQTLYRSAYGSDAHCWETESRVGAELSTGEVFARRFGRDR